MEESYHEKGAGWFFRQLCSVLTNGMNCKSEMNLTTAANTKRISIPKTHFVVISTYFSHMFMVIELSLVAPVKADANHAIAHAACSVINGTRGIRPNEPI